MTRAAFLLLMLSGCAALPSLVLTGAGQALAVDFEAATPQHVERLRRGGVQLPRASPQLADPRAHRDYVEGRVTAVGFGLSAGGYVLYCEGLPHPVLVPESQVDLGLTQAVPRSVSIHPDRDAALAEGASTSGHETYGYYRGAGGALIVPTLFSPASTPRIARTMLAVRQQLSETGQRELKVLLLGLTGTRVLQGIVSRVVRVGTEPAPPPQPVVPRPGTVTPSAPPPTPVPTPAPVPAPLAPSPGLVRALSGNNPTPAVSPGPRLPQDVAVKPTIPPLLQTTRSIGPSPSQNAQLQADIHYLKSLGARNIRVNQQQIIALDKQRVGTNRPDLQFDYMGRRYHVEYDSPTSNRGHGHQSRITSNDPNAETILLTIP